MAVDNKYGVVTVEIEPGNPLNDTDEPVFVIRARDKSAPLALKAYAEFNSHLAGQVQQALEAFKLWRDAHPDLVKMAD